MKKVKGTLIHSNGISKSSGDLSLNRSFLCDDSVESSFKFLTFVVYLLFLAAPFLSAQEDLKKNPAAKVAQFNKALDGIDSVWKEMEGEFFTQLGYNKFFVQSLNAASTIIDPAFYTYGFTRFISTDPILSSLSTLKLKPVRNWQVTFTLDFSPTYDRIVSAPTTPTTTTPGGTEELGGYGYLKGIVALETTAGDSLRITATATSLDQTFKLGPLDVPTNGGKAINYNSGVAQGAIERNSWNYSSKQIKVSLSILKPLVFEPVFNFSLLWTGWTYPNNYPAGPYRDLGIPSGTPTWVGWFSDKLQPDADVSVRVRVRPTFWFQLGGGIQTLPQGAQAATAGIQTGYQNFKYFYFLNSEFKMTDRITITGGYRFEESYYNGNPDPVSTYANTTLYDPDILRNQPKMNQLLGVRNIDSSGITLGFRFR